ncbi:PTS lactose/cellobiose transporter subunit IIA [Borrelia sp. BU AG58]|uniref:PTS lactose/cellobiose transporter subunit IIA n=1 Tax=Borrelia sp. BU AG58 TaxID=2887345 RepID=UPI001E3B0B71|nr:PTS lactose/cellobiose transporter subunit IIA [Borrelia sp. BU AG58]UER67263.1 PTS lactose/cellobiose transporter subunit IIA [Borrelia sp. BU AG58]
MLSDELNRYIGDRFMLVLDKVCSVRHKLYELLKEVKKGNFEDIEYELSEVETLIVNVNALQAEFMSDGEFAQNVHLSLTIFNIQNCIMGLMSEKNLVEELIYLNKKIQDK